MDVYAWAHNETSTVCHETDVPPCRRGGRRRARRRGRHLGRRRAAAGRGPRWTPTTFAPQKLFGSDGGLWLALMKPGRARARRRPSRRPGGGSRRSSTCRRAIDNARQEPDVQHAVRGDALPHGRDPGVDERRRRALLCSSTRPHRGLGVAPVRLGLNDGAPSRSATVVDPAARSQVVGTIDLDKVGGRRRGRDGAAGQRDRRHRAVPQARAQPAEDRDVPRRRAGRRLGAHVVASTTWSSG